jgi:hypothetical protein
MQRPDYEIQAMFFVVRPDSIELTELAAMVDDGRLRIVVSQSCPLAHRRQAFEGAGFARPPGKTVLIVR